MQRPLEECAVGTRPPHGQDDLLDLPVLPHLHAARHWTQDRQGQRQQRRPLHQTLLLVHLLEPVQVIYLRQNLIKTSSAGGRFGKN